MAGNSGRPGGGCGHIAANGEAYVDKLKNSHVGQEEDIMSNWLITHKNVENADVN